MNSMQSGDRMRISGKLKRRGMLCGMAMLAGACQSTKGTQTFETNQGGATFCQIAKAIYYSRHDTAPTIKQIREHNAVGAALKCGWLPAKKAKS